MASDGGKIASSSQKAKQDNADGAGGRLRLGFSSLLTIIFLSVAAIALAYIGGVMSGRHLYAPVPNAQVRTDQKKITPAEKSEDHKILSAEELEFARVLRGESRPTPPISAESIDKQPQLTGIPQKGTPEEASQPVATEAKKPQESGINVSTQTPLPTSVEGISDYVFQLAAFKDETGADRLRQQLEGFGLRTRLEKDGKLCIVLVLIRGSEERVAELANIAAQLRLGTPLMRSRNAVPH